MIDLFPEARVDPGIDPDKRYTTPETMALCMKLAGVTKWDLDVAADAESHWAAQWYGVEQDGLKQPWWGNVWCNPPFSDIEPWLENTKWELAINPRGDIFVAMLLPANRTEQSWWHRHIEPIRDGRDSCFTLVTHFLPSRVRYGHPGNPRGHGAGSPPFASVLLVWRST